MLKRGIQACSSQNWYLAVVGSNPVTSGREQRAVSEVTARVQNRAKDSPRTEQQDHGPGQRQEDQEAEQGKPLVDDQVIHSL